MRKLLSNRKWILTTILAILGVMVLIRLGIWQLDRLAWRRSFNNQYLSQINQPDVNLNEITTPNSYSGMEYRGAIAEGSFDFSYEVFLQNQAHNNLPGYRVLTPFKLNNEDFSIIVDRGWIALDDIDAIDEIDQINPVVNEIRGVIRASQEKTDFGFDPDIDKDRNSKLFTIVNLGRIQEQIPYPIAPFYIQLESQNSDEYPVANLPEVEITEGSHLGYAIQWFFFASLLGIGYPFYLVNISRSDQRKQEVDKND